MFSCPVYKYPKRNDKYLIFRVKLQPEPKGAPPEIRVLLQLWHGDFAVLLYYAARHDEDK